MRTRPPQNSAAVKYLKILLYLQQLGSACASTLPLRTDPSPSFNPRSSSKSKNSPVPSISRIPANIRVSRQTANDFLKELHQSKKRLRRSNSGIFEEFQGGNFERECHEEICVKEEALETVGGNEARGEEIYDRVANQCGIFDPCDHFGTSYCVNSWQSYSCTCKQHYRGKHCNISDREEMKKECISSGYCNNGKCSVEINDQYALYKVCTCHAGFEGETCKTDIDECQLNPGVCNSGTCVNTAGSYHCECPDTKSGEFCEEDINECLRAELKNQILCYQGQCQDKNDGYYCTCENGWQGDDCSLDIDECLSNPCDQGKCINVPGDFRCECNPGFHGEFCVEDVDECLEAEEKGQDLCLNGSKCLNNRGSYTCQCAENSGFEGRHCEIDIDECKVNKDICGIGSCTNSLGSYSCSCPKEREGKNCENIVHECDFKPVSICGYYGTCSKQNITKDGNQKPYKCDCVMGVSGDLCDIDFDECSIDEDLCEHGKCINTLGSFECQCTSGRKGQYCEIDVDECKTEEITCHEKSTCHNLVERPIYRDVYDAVTKTNNSIKTGKLSPGYECRCKDQGFKGDKCDKDIDECVELIDACPTNSTCSNYYGGYDCHCHFMLSGHECLIPEKNITQAVDTFINQHRIAMFSKSYCKYSKKAKKILDHVAGKDAYTFTEIDELEPDVMDTVQEYLGVLTGDTTVPRVFIEQKFIGGASEIHDLYRMGKLQKMVNP